MIALAGRRVLACLIFLVGMSAQSAAANSAESLVRLGDEMFWDGRYEDAYRQYTAALRFDEHREVTLNNRAMALVRLGRLNDALVDLNEAIRLRPASGSVWNNRANVHCALRNVKKSIYDRMQALYMGRFTATQAQNSLRRSGFFQGPTNGSWGDESDIALEDWTRSGCPRAPASRLITPIPGRTRNVGG